MRPARLQIHFADGTTWTSAPAFSHGGTAYVGAWIAVYLPAGEGTQLSFKVSRERGAGCCQGRLQQPEACTQAKPRGTPAPRSARRRAPPPCPTQPATRTLHTLTHTQVHDHSSSGVVQCSGGSVSAWGTLELPAAAAAAGAGWRHATLELQAGRATRLTQKLEQALADAGDRVGDRMEAVADATSRAGSKHMAPGEPADAAAAVSEPEAAAAAPEAGAAGVPAVEAVTPEGGSDGAAPAGAAAAETTADASEAGQGASSAAEGSAAADDLEADILAAGCVRLRLSFRPLQPAPSALLLRQLAGTAAEAEAAAAAGLRGKKSVIRLLPQPGASEAKEAAGGGAGAAAAAEVEAEEGRRPPGAEPPLEGAGADQMLPIELPLEALPRHLHSYGHGGEWVNVGASAGACSVRDYLQLAAERGCMPLPVPLPTSGTLPCPHRACAAAFMGAALSLIGSQRWQAILKQEDPSGFHSARRWVLPCSGSADFFSASFAGSSGVPLLGCLLLPLTLH